ncbi:MAG: type II secretion system F family protein [Holosporaceae bacterium]|jgi:type II secretory pathway component PulF|nr:type II secretion system F family protein [Holosporaceae bacterium]
MPLYKYQVLTKSGEKKHGILLSDDYKQAYEVLHSKQYLPIKIKKIYCTSRKISPEKLLMFFMHIELQLKCGVRINDAIESFSGFQEDRILNASLVDIADLLKRGESISDAFEKCHAIFDDVIIGLFRSAENTGEILDVITNILKFLKLQTEWRDNVKRAIAYPIFITIVAILVLIISVGVLGPQVISLIQICNNGEIPILTQFTINILPQIFEIACAFFPALLLILVIVLLSRKNRSLFLLKIPVIKKLITQIVLWNFYKIMHIALSAKLDFIQALTLAIDAVKFDSIKKELENIRNDIIDGYGISESFSEKELIPAEVLMVIRIGEEGNDLKESFYYISDDQYKRILLDIEVLGRRLSIGLTIFTGLIFIFILCTLFYPIYSYIEIASM